MAQTVEEIAETLNTLKLEYEYNTEGFDKVLTSINSKLDLMAEDSEATDLIKVYLAELKKAVNDKHSYTVSMFSEMENSLANILSSFEDSAKTSEIRDLFQFLTANVNAFSNEINVQKVLVEKIDNKLETLSNDNTDKYEIIAQVSSIKNDFEDLNSAIGNSFTDINEIVKSMAVNIQSLDLEAQNEVVRKELEKISQNSNAILSAIKIQESKSSDISNLISSIPSKINFDNINSKMNDYTELLIELKDIVSEIPAESNDFAAEQFLKLEKSFESMVTDVDFADFRSDLSEFVQKIIDNSSALNSELNYTAERIENILSTVKSLDFRDDFQNIINRVNDIKETFENGSKVNYESLSKEILGLSDKFANSFEELDDDRKVAFESLKIDLEETLNNVSMSFATLINESNENADNNYNAVREYFEELTSRVNNMSEEFRQTASSAFENSSRILSSIDVVSDKIEMLKTDLKQIVETDNSGDILLNIDDISFKVDTLNDNFSNTSMNNFEKLQLLIGEISGDIQKQHDGLSSENQQNVGKQLEQLQTLSNDISRLQMMLNAVGIEYKTVVEDKVNALKDYMSKIGDSLYDSMSDGDNIINQKLVSLDELSHGFEAALIDVNVNLQNIIKNLMTMDVTEQNDIIKRELENIFIGSNSILTALKISDQKNDEIANMISGLVNKEDNEESLNRLDGIIIKAQELSESISLLPTKTDFKNVSDKLLEFSNVLMSIKNIITTSSDTNSEMIGEQFVKFESAFSKVVTEEDFAQFRAEFTGFIQKIIDNSTILNFNSENNKIQINEILSKIDSLNYTDDFENIAIKINDIKDSFEDNSKINYENLSQEMATLSEHLQKCFEGLDSNGKESFAILRDEIESVFDVVKHISDSSPQKSLELLNGISTEIRSVIAEIEGNLNSNLDENFDNLKSAVNKMVDDLNEVKEDFVQKSDMHTFNIATGFDTFKVTVDKLSETFENLKSELLQNNNTSMEKIAETFSDVYEKTVVLINSMEEKSCTDASVLRENIQNLAFKFEQLEQDFSETSSLNAENILGSIQDVSRKLDNIKSDVITEATNNFSELKESLCENVKHAEMKLGDKSDENKEQINSVIQSLRDYISELNIASKSSKSLSESKFAEKLLTIEDLISNGSINYNESISILQSKIAAYIQSVESATSQTDSKIGDSIVELKDIKSELMSLSEQVKSDFSHNDEKFTQTVSFIDTGIQEIIENISSINSSVQAGINISLRENLLTVDEKFESLIVLFNELKSDNVEGKQNLLNDLEEKVSGLKQEINLVNTDIADALNVKSEEIIRSFEPIKNNIDTLLDIDFGVTLSDIKAQIELSYMNINTDMTNGFIENKESTIRLQQAYIEVMNKLDSIKENLGEQTQNNIELLKLAIENVSKNVDSNLDQTNIFITEWKDEIIQIKEKLVVASENYSNTLALFTEDLKNVIDDKLNNYIEDLKSHIGITLNTDDTMQAIDALKEELNSKFNSLLIEEAGINEKTALIHANVQAFGDTLKEYVQSACENTLDRINQTVKDVNALGTMVDNNNEVVGVIENLKNILSEEINQRLSKFITVQSDLDKNTADKMAGMFVSFDQKLEKIKHDVNSFIYSAQMGKEQSEILDEIYALRNGEFMEENQVTPEILNIIDHLETKIKSLDAKNPHDEYINSIMETNKTKLLAELYNIKEISEDYLKSSKESLETLHQKIDMFVLGDDDNNDIMAETLESISEKIDIIALGNDNQNDDLVEALETINDKIDVIAGDTSILDLNDKIEDLAITEEKISETLSALHEKVDTLALFNDNDDFDVENEIEDIKNLILEQRKFFETTEATEKTEALSSGLEELLSKIQNIENGLNDVDINKNSQDIKESIMSAIVSVFDQVSFVEETEEIKDFVEERTERISKHLQEVKDQLKQIASGGEGSDYLYTLQDVESDIAKLRIALSDISNSTSKDEIHNLSDNINKIVTSVEGLQSSLTPDQMFDLKEDIERLNEDIISISARTNKLLLTSDDSYRALSSGLEKFSNVVSDLEEKISYIDYTEVNERFERKIDAVKAMVTSSVNSDKVVHQVMMYLGEWIDSTSEKISSITEETSEIKEIRNMITELKETVPNKSDLLDELEQKFENQETRIDRLEMKIERILSTLEEKDDMVLNNKVDKIENQLSRLSINIEKLASYVDEE